MVSSTNRPNRNDCTKSTFKVQLKILEEENSLFHLFSVAKKDADKQKGGRSNVMQDTHHRM